ncbi:IclR family transcriptional regulator [Allonocardiopsis opalescens]|uniref:Glycerol operon regulatory protein n=1 Tax=Allonocardiopsis opalescens TaxID=1144618 RepID=A0A2T0QEJ4_9ACTN|nr:IclR family transcriptional regulator [Allonocardiopsis opalescens]PRY02322.1 IclR family transcriptional regulator [Allonocardiopsis opalescens]
MANSTNRHINVSSVQSVDRAVSVLEILARHGAAGVTEIAVELGVHKSTAFRLLDVLENRGLVEQAEERGKYQLGLGIVRLAGATAAQLDIVQEGQPVCERLAEELGETVNIAIADGDGAVNVVQTIGAAAITGYNWVGRRTPLHATSSGKVLLAFMPPDQRRNLLPRRLPRHTEHTLTSAARLREELVAVVERGYATCEEELEVGLNSVAAPVRSFNGSVIAALSVSGPAFRLTGERLPAVAARTAEAADEVSRRMGFG